MEIQVLKIAMLSFCMLLILWVLKDSKEQFYFFLMLSYCFFLFYLSFQGIQKIIALLSEISILRNSSVYVGLLFKSVMICYLSEFLATLCKDSGLQTMARQIEIFCKCSVLWLGLPILVNMLQKIEVFLQ